MSRLKRLPVWQENPGESEVVKTKRPESSKVPEGAQTGGPGRGCGTAAASGQPRRRAGEPREGRERSRVPASTVSTFLRREGQSCDENRPGRPRGLRKVRRLCNRRRGEWKRGDLRHRQARPGGCPAGTETASLCRKRRAGFHEAKASNGQDAGTGEREKCPAGPSGCWVGGCWVPFNSTASLGRGKEVSLDGRWLFSRLP